MEKKKEIKCKGCGTTKHLLYKKGKNNEFEKIDICYACKIKEIENEK